MSRTNKEEKVRVRRVPNPQLSLQRVQISDSMAHQIKKVTHSSLGEGRDKNSSLGKFESFHKIPLRKNIKKIV